MPWNTYTCSYVVINMKSNFSIVARILARHHPVPFWGVLRSGFFVIVMLKNLFIKSQSQNGFVRKYFSFSHIAVYVSLQYPPISKTTDQAVEHFFFVSYKMKTQQDPVVRRSNNCHMYSNSD
jgi:hypothetical protein